MPSPDLVLAAVDFFRSLEEPAVYDLVESGCCFPGYPDPFPLLCDFAPCSLVGFLARVCVDADALPETDVPFAELLAGSLARTVLRVAVYC